MTTKTLQVIVWATVWALGTGKAEAQHPRSTSPQIRSATNAEEYLKVATYFRRREIEFRAKAQNVIHDYMLHPGPYAMATKTVTRAEVAARQVSEYSSKADENARLAATYDKALSELGRPTSSVPTTVVSVKDLQAAAGGN